MASSSSSSSSSKLLTDEDYYEVLGVPYDADEGTIKRAYRLKALKCHPDKNPDNPRAADEFHGLSRAYDVLSDEKAKLAYDGLLRGKMARKKKFESLDAGRRRMQEDLLERETYFKKQKQDEKEADAMVRSKIERLKADGERRRKEREAELARSTEEAKRIAEDQKAAERYAAIQAILEARSKRKKRPVE